LEVLRRVQSDAGLRTIPIVIPTLPPEERGLMASGRSGVNACVVKPGRSTSMGFAEGAP
jgi:hypothetical protein